MARPRDQPICRERNMNWNLSLRPQIDSSLSPRREPAGNGGFRARVAHSCAPSRAAGPHRCRARRAHVGSRPARARISMDGSFQRVSPARSKRPSRRDAGADSCRPISTASSARSEGSPGGARAHPAPLANSLTHNTVIEQTRPRAGRFRDCSTRAGNCSCGPRRMYRRNWRI